MKNISKKKKCIHWASWSKLSKKKSLGGPRFKNIHEFNIVLLGKQDWRLMKHPNKLVSKVFKVRYYSQGSFINAKIGHNPSYIWRNVIETREVLKHGLGCRVGNGATINILEDPWLPLVHEAYIKINHPVLHGQMVTSLLSDNGN